MDIIRVIEERRSIRKFKNLPIEKELVEKVLDLATKAPSGKNRQPWRFIVLQNKKKDELVKLMNGVVNTYRKQGIDAGSCEISIRSINEAPVVVLVFNAFSNFEEGYDNYRSLVDTQSIGAAIQNMILASQDLGLGTLWICDIFYCDREICSWLNRKEELVAAVAIGYADQSPHPRPRKNLSEVTEWMD